MALNFGSSAISTVMLGDKQVDRIMLGGTEVWSAKVTPASMGASNWLDFTDGLTDKGLAPQAWRGGPPSGGYLPASKNADMYPVVSPVDNTQPISWTAWFQPTGTSTVLNTYITVQPSASINLSMRMQPSTRALGWFRSHGNTAQTAVSAGTATTGWNFVACVMEPVSGTTFRHRAYLNGAELFNTTFDGGTQLDVVNGMFRQNAATNFGNADDFAIYPVALTATQITALYQAGRSA